MIIPIRKCYHTAKIGIIVFVLVTVFTLFEHWRGRKRGAHGFVPGSKEAEYEKQILEDEARIIPGLGEGGVAVELVGHEKEIGAISVKKNAMNVYLSERIAYNRTLKDHRHPACKRVLYDAELPSVSVILIFHNEPYSVVIRTIWSVLNNARRDREWYKLANFVDKNGKTMTLGYPGQPEWSPYVYLKEIILVDDNSTLPELKGKLDHYIRTRLPADMIKVLRLPDRKCSECRTLSLTRARLFGAQVATGAVLLFLDTHCEGNHDWLRPLLQRLKDKRSALITPMVDGEGLMKARTLGARAARGQVILFLDAHCEAASDWLRPLLQRIKHKRDAVVTPLIDVIDQDSFQLDAAEYFQVGGFNFAGHFTWVEVPEREKKRRGSEISPTWSPTMAGGLFAVDRAYFWQLGGYDELMNGWGGENLEISFRTWMCGGTLETIPCSRVGHVFRSFHPYGLPASSDTHGINTARLADVWMDDYAELYYMHRPDLRKNPTIGDLTHRKVLREKLKCKSFQWYLDNVYPEKFVPGRNTQAWGRFMNPATNLCLDSLQRSGSEGLPLGVFTCYPQLQTTQMYALSDKQRLRDEESCAEVQHHREPVTAGQPVLMFSCSSVVHERQKWQFLPTGQIKHIQSGLCLDAGHKQDTDVSVQACNKLSLSQLWLADFRKGEPINPDLIPMEDQRENLQRIMGYHSRKTRSLLMLDNNRVEPVDSRDTVTTRPRHDYTRDRPVYPHSRGYRRAHMHKRKYKRRNKKRVKNDLRGRRIKIKNRFMLTLIRTIDNKTEQHLEAEIHCRHEQLYPNNSFVRDIVRILNDHHIKVINNGRVFERNNMIDLSHERMRRKMEDVTGRDDVTARSEPITDRPRDATDMRAQPTSPSLYLQQHVDVVTSPSLRDTTTHQRVIPDDKWHRRLKSFKFRALTDAPDGLLRHSHSLSEEDLPPRVWHGEGGGTGERGGEPVMHLADERRDDPSGVNDLLSVIAEGGETRRSKNMSSARRHLDPDPAPDEQNDVSPVKFVMRSNITLNLGNQLFGRRVIELNTSSTAPTSPPTPAPLLPTTTPAPPPSVARVFDSSSDTSSESRSSD